MGLFGRMVIALLLSTPVLCQKPSRAGLASILQNIISSNPQLLKMASNGGCEAPIRPVVQGQYLSSFQNQFARQPTVIELPYPGIQPAAPCYPTAVTPVQPVPVQPVKEVYQYPVAQQIQTVNQCCQPPIPYTCPAPLVNPFLPAASPVSAMAPPTSNLLPPVNPRINKSQFLRKVPFPPPCI